jgi:hypothetical protein
MQKQSPLMPALMIMVMVAAIVAGGDYYVFSYLNLPEIVGDVEKYKFENMAINMFQKLSPLPRFLPAIAFISLFLFIDPKDRTGRRKEMKKPSMKAFIISLAIMLVVIVILSVANEFPPKLFEYLVPVLYIVVLICSMVVGFRNRILFKDRYGIHNDTIVRKDRYSITFRVANNLIKGFVNIKNLFQGTLVVGGAGAGKTRSVFVPYIQEMVKMGFTGFVYDLKFNDPSGNLTRWVIKAFHENNITDKKLWIVNFTNLRQTHRVNPIAPEYLTIKEFCSEYSLAFIKNMDKQYVKNLDFWGNSAYAIFSSVMWFLRRNEPDKCTLPHCISLVLNDYNKVMDMVMKDPDCKDMIISVETARQQDAGPQLAGAFATLQVPLAKMSTPNLYWVLSSNDFSLDLNNPETPGIFCIGNYIDLPEIYSPVISTIATVISKRVNKPQRKPFFFMVDEAPTCYIPGLESLPNTGRSNDIAVVIGVQDYSQLDDMYGRDKSRVMLASLSNVFIGMVNDTETAEKVAKMFGKEEVEIETKSRSSSSNTKSSGMSTSSSFSTKEKEVVSPKYIQTQKRGEFVGKIVDAEVPFFQGKILVDIKPDEKTNPDFELKDFVDFGKNDVEKLVRLNYDKIKEEVEEMLFKYTGR